MEAIVFRFECVYCVLHFVDISKETLRTDCLYGKSEKKMNFKLRVIVSTTNDDLLNKKKKCALYCSKNATNFKLNVQLRKM